MRTGSRGSCVVDNGEDVEPAAENAAEIQAAVRFIVETEQAGRTPGIGPVIDSRFVLQCLDANELGDGLLYAALHKDKFVFAKGAEVWYVWDRHSWRRDEMDLAIAAVENVALRYAEEIEVQGAKLADAMKDPSDDGKAVQRSIRARIDNLQKRISRLRKDSGRSNCLKFAHTNPVLSLAIRAADFDLNPWLLACDNGVINLQTGELEPGNPADYISKRAKASFPGVAVDTSFWSDVLLDIYSADDNLVDYMRRLYGYGITGLNIEHVFPVLVGRGRNGKSLVVEAISHALGDYAGPVPAEMLLDSARSTTAGGTSPEIMALKGLRLAIASETDEGRRFSAAKVKWLTGGDSLTGRGLYDKHLITFQPTHLLMLLTNHQPNAPDSDYAFWERCFLVDHLLSFVDRAEGEELKPHERRANKTLPTRLREQADTILAWLVRGCLEWQQIGLAPPKSVVESTRGYQEDENYMGQFLEAVCDQGPHLKSSATELYEAFTHWYKAHINPKERYLPSQKAFGSKLKAAELFERQRISGCYHYKGVAVSDAYKAAMAEDEQKKKGSKGDDPPWK